MKKISLADLLSIKEYEAQRPIIRKAIMEHKKTRRVDGKFILRETNALGNYLFEYFQSVKAK